MIDFHLDQRSGVPPYLQVVQQVHHALRLSVLQKGDQLPTVKEVVAKLAINPNTVLKAYRELERDGLVEGRPGQGTFVIAAPNGPSPRDRTMLQEELARWLRQAYSAGLSGEDVAALFAEALRPVALSAKEDVA
ncbi:MAG: GntR family transcriptional regulator [Thermomicrobiales bacterium]